MRSSGIRLASLLAAAAISGLGAQVAGQTWHDVKAGEPLQDFVHSARKSSTSARRAGKGWTNKHAQRVAKKKRNVKRTRAMGRD